MATVKSIKDYKKLMDKRVQGLKQAGIKTSADSANLMVKYAKRNAPRKTGATRNGIRRRKSKDGYTVESWVPGTFKQNLFANQTAPFRTLNIKKFNRYFKAPQQVMYGKSAESPTGKPIRWTGQPRFFLRATEKLIPVWRKRYLANTSKALRVNV